MRNMLIIQTLKITTSRTDFPIYGYKNDFKPDVHIVLNDVNNPYFSIIMTDIKLGFVCMSQQDFLKTF